MARDEQIDSQRDPVGKQTLGQHFRHQRAAVKQTGHQQDFSWKAKQSPRKLVGAPREDTKGDVRENEF